MITHEECKTAQEHAQANLDQVKQIESQIDRRPEPIYSESGKVIGHRLVKVGTKLPKPVEVPKAEQKPTEGSKIEPKFTNNMKTCTKCGESLPLTAFGKSKNYKDGLNSRCKYCVNEVFREAYNAKRGKAVVKQEKAPLPTAHRSISVVEVVPRSNKQDQGKLRYDLCPPEWSEALAEVMTGGLIKYEPNSWRGGEPYRYESALMRHLVAWRKGETVDPESGLNHLKHIAVNALILLTLTSK